MPITRTYQPDAGLVMDAAFAAGRGQRDERQQATGFQQKMANQQFDLQVDEFDENRRRYNEQFEYQQVQDQLQRDAFLERENVRQQGLLDRLRFEDEIEQRTLSNRMRGRPVEYTPEQSREYQQINQSIQSVMQDPSFSDLEKQQAVRHLRAKQLGILDSPVAKLPEQSPYPESQDVGDIWAGPTGDLLTRDADGSVKKVADSPAKTNAAMLKNIVDMLSMPNEEGLLIPPSIEEVQKWFQTFGGGLPTQGAVAGPQSFDPAQMNRSGQPMRTEDSTTEAAMQPQPQPQQPSMQGAPTAPPATLTELNAERYDFGKIPKRKLRTFNYKMNQKKKDFRKAIRQGDREKAELIKAQIINMLEPYRVK